MKTIFQPRFLLVTIGLLSLLLYMQHYVQESQGATRRLGGPVEIAHQANPYGIYLLLLLRFLMVGFLVPSGIGLLVCAVLRWRHPAYQVFVKRPVILSVLVWCAWGLLNALLFTMVVNSISERDNEVVQLVSLLTSVGWVIAAARLSYYQERIPRHLVEGEPG